MAECGPEVNSNLSRCEADVNSQYTENSQGLKRESVMNPSSGPLLKSPRTHSPPSSTQQPAEEQMDPSRAEVQDENLDRGVLTIDTSLSPNSRRKSWRRSTRGRRSLPALPNTTHTLCRSISPSLPEQDRLEKLLEASIRLALQKTKDSLQTLPNANLESFQTQMDSIQNEWCSLAKAIRSEPKCQLPSANTARDPAMQSTIEQSQKAIHRLQAENEAWEALLIKHRCKAEELARRVVQGQQSGVTLDPASLSQSSQSQFIQSKPDYHNILCRQQPLLNTVELVMDSQCKIVRELLSVQEQAGLMVKETSSRLATEVGFEDLPSDPIRSLLAGPVATMLA